MRLRSWPAILLFAALSLVLVGRAKAQESLVTRDFQAPRNFVYVHDAATAVAHPEDFCPSPETANDASSKDRVPLIPTARGYLESCGIAFPAGSSATLNPFSNVLSVTNTQANLAIGQALIESLREKSPRVLSFMLTVVEGPADEMRRMNAAASVKQDASKELAALLKQSERAQSSVRVVGEIFVTNPPGNRSLARSVVERRLPLGFDGNRKNDVIPELETYAHGLKLDIDATLDYLNAKRLVGSVSLEINPEGPFERPGRTSIPGTTEVVSVTSVSRPFMRLSPQITMETGQTRLLCVATPPRKFGDRHPSALWATFLTAHVVLLDEAPVVQMGAARNLAAPSGMQTVAFELPEGLLENALRTEAPLQPFLESRGLAPTPGAMAELQDGILTVVNTAANIERVAALVHRLAWQQPKTVALTLYTVRGKGAFLRAQAAKAAPLAHHQEIWMEVQKGIQEGLHDLKIINTMHGEAKLGAEARVSAVQEHMYLASYKAERHGIALPSFETRNQGAELTFTPTKVTYDGTTEVELRVESQPLPPQASPSPTAGALSADNPIHVPAISFHVQEVDTNLSFANGSIRLVSLTRPDGVEGDDQVLATFVRCHVVPQVVHAQFRPKPALQAKSAAGVTSSEFYTRSFRVSPDFLAFPVLYEDEKSIPSDPLAPAPDSSQYGEEQSAETLRRKSAKEILEAAGIPFPPGSSVSTGGPTSALIVRNTQENLDKVEAFVREMNERAVPLPLVYTTHIIEAPAPLLRHIVEGLGSRYNHRVEMDSLLKAAAEGRARCRTTSRIETLPFTRATDEHGIEHSFISEIARDDKGKTTISTESRLVGFRHELESSLHAERMKANLVTSLEFHTSEPVSHDAHVTDSEGRKLVFPLTDFQVMKLTTETIIPPGAARLLAVWKPVAREHGASEDILQAAFVTCDILRPVK